MKFQEPMQLNSPMASLRIINGFILSTYGLLIMKLIDLIANIDCQPLVSSGWAFGYESVPVAATPNDELSSFVQRFMGASVLLLHTL